MLRGHPSVECLKQGVLASLLSLQSYRTIPDTLTVQALDREVPDWNVSVRDDPDVFLQGKL